jgi:(2R)-3-sulfolactate dehydrogenase (NADP+)
MLADEGVRLPGAKREAQSTRAEANGLEVPDALIAAIRALAT